MTRVLQRKYLVCFSKPTIFTCRIRPNQEPNQIDFAGSLKGPFVSHKINDKMRSMHTNQIKAFLFIGLSLLSGSLFGQCVSIFCPPSTIIGTDSGQCSAVANYVPPVGIYTCGTPVSTTFNYTGSTQTYTVPLGVNELHLEAFGAQGGSVSLICSATGGRGARIAGYFPVTGGEVLTFRVGRQGYSNDEDAGGGGGTFVVRNGNVPMIIAGGGGGATNNAANCGSNRNGRDASISNSGTSSADGLVLGGSNGNGGNANTGRGGAGGGFYTNGAAGAGNASSGGKAWSNGSLAGSGTNFDHGGYGGGGAGNNTTTFYGGNGGGGGGYSGGGTSGSVPYSGGGGGGSFNAGTNQSNSSGVQTGNGKLIITYYTQGPPNYTSMLQGLPTGSTFPLGSTTMTYFVTDNIGSTDSCSFSITVEDQTPPTIDCPNDVDTVVTQIGCASIVNYAPPTVYDACSGASYSMVSGLPSGAVFPLGTTTVDYLASDSAGNTSSCNFQVTVSPDSVPGPQNYRVCAGDTLELYGQQFYNTTAYRDTLQDIHGCDSMVIAFIIVLPPLVVNMAVVGNTIFAGVPGGVSYQWIDCGNGNALIPGATTSQYTTTQGGSFAVMVVTQDGCSATSACETLVGSAEPDAFGFEVYPNPTSGKLAIRLGEIANLVVLEVMDLTGRRIILQEFRDEQWVALDLGNLQDGSYFLRATTNAGTVVRRIVKLD